MFLGIQSEVNFYLIAYYKQLMMRIWRKRKKKSGRKLFFNSLLVTPDRSKLEFNRSYLNELARKYEGKLLLRKEIALHDDIFQKLLVSSEFKPLLPIQRNLMFTTCTRCNNTKKSLFALLSCALCGRTHYYCRKCITMGRVMECEPLYYWTGDGYRWPKLSQPCKWDGTLTKAQQKAADRINNVIQQGGELLVWAVAGAGKTEMLFPGITTALREGKRICIATPRADVVRELLPRLQQAFPKLHIQGLYSGSRDNDGTTQLMIATTHQLLRYRHAFDVLIIDEIDAFPYHQDPSLQFAARRAVKSTSSLIYLTATPREKQQFQIAAKKLSHVFVPLRFHGYPLPMPKMIRSSSLNRNLATSRLPFQFIRWLRERQNPTRQLLIFAPTIQLANDLKKPITELLLDEKIINYPTEVEHVHAEDKNREEKIMRFRQKQLSTLITTTILERGVTFPAVDVVVLHAGHHVFDEAALIQIAGRAGRSPIDPTGEVIFFHEGKTNAMVRAKKDIYRMNKRGKLLLEETDHVKDLR